MTSLEDQITVVAMHKRGSSVSVISKALKLHREQVHQIISRFGETEGIENRPRGRPKVKLWVVFPVTLHVDHPVYDEGYD
ncbi:hypothetical protein Y032_0036g3175 [Ancylostoma ceylanicum]|nr:hypothetical protein Y032_0036g3175 [Ancylostoma ceylanicum]